MSDTALICW